MLHSWSGPSYTKAGSLKESNMAEMRVSDSKIAQNPAEVLSACRAFSQQYGDVKIQIRDFTKRASAWAGMTEKELQFLFTGMPRVEIIPQFL